MVVTLGQQLLWLYNIGMYHMYLRMYVVMSYFRRADEALLAAALTGFT